MKKAITCIGCPLGCPLEVELTAAGAVAEVQGHGCRRGEAYARQECLNPTRMVTASLPVAGRRQPLSVRTDRPLPKALIPACLEAIRACRPVLPVRIGAVLIADIGGSGVDVIATRNLE